MINYIRINRYCLMVKRLIIILLVFAYNSIVIAQVGYLNIDTTSTNQINILFKELPVSEKTKIIAIGETHSFYTENTVLITTAFETLLQKFGNFNLVLERPFAESYLINEYLKNDNLTIFEYAKNKYDNYYKQLKHLKEIYNSTGSKFEVIGLDISGKEFRKVCLLAMKSIFDQRSKPSEKINIDLSKEFRTLEKISFTWWKFKHKRKLKKICKKVYLKLEEGEEYNNEQVYFGEDWQNIKRIIINYHLGTLYRELKEDKVDKREDILYKRLEELIMKNPNSKYLVHFGEKHVVKDEYPCNCKIKYKSFISKLYDDEIDIISISTVYNYDSGHYMYKEFNWDGQKEMLFMFQFKDNEIIDKIEKVSFDGNNYLIETEETVTSKNYDYILVLNTILGTIEWEEF